jgi:hypothetical protein
LRNCSSPKTRSVPARTAENAVQARQSLWRSMARTEPCLTQPEVIMTMSLYTSQGTRSRL